MDPIKLTANQRRMVNLFVQGHTWEQVARALGVSRAAVAHKFRCLFKILGITETGDGTKDRASLAPWARSGV